MNFNDPTPRTIPFAHDLSPVQEQLHLNLPICKLCDGRGYTACDQASGPRGEIFITIAWRFGIACTCPTGREFLDDQCRWLELDSPKTVTRQIPTPVAGPSVPAKDLESIGEIIAWCDFPAVGKRELERRRLEQIAQENREALRVLAEYAAKQAAKASGADRPVADEG
jgi:hypothetical protein